MLLLIFGFAGIYAKNKQAIVSTIGTFLTVAGFALLAGIIMFFEGSIATDLVASKEGPAVLAPDGPLFSGMSGVVLMAIFIFTSLGVIINGISIAMTKSMPMLAGILIMAIVLTMFTPPLPYLVGQLGAILFGAGCVWLASRLMR